MQALNAAFSAKDKDLYREKGLALAEYYQKDFQKTLEYYEWKQAMSVTNAAYLLEVTDAYYAEETAAAEKMAEYEILTGRRVAHEEIALLDDRLAAYKTTFAGGVKSALMEIEDADSNTGQLMGDFTKRTFSSMADTLAENTMNMSWDFTNLANSVIKDLLRIYYQQQVLAPLAKAGGSWLSGLFGQSNLMGLSSEELMVAERHGDVFSRGNIIPFGRGDIITHPTLLPMANGNVALTGEAGTEGILPLGRTSGGDLGVKTVGSQAQTAPQSVEVRIINSGQPAQVSKSKASFDMQKMVVSVWIDALDRNVGGLQDRLGR
jgi:lambda family phage tail tape measure protein